MRKGVVITPSDLIGVDWVAKMKSLGLNTLGIHSGGGAAHDVLGVLGKTIEPEFRERLRAAGIDYEYELHVSQELMPRNLFTSHPEYFIQPFRAKERSANGNWCSARTEALGVVGNCARSLGEKLAPSTHRHFFWGEDSAASSWCHCDECAALSDAEQYLLSVNAMAEQLRQFDPEAQVAFLAYCSTMERPRRVQPAGNVFLEYAPFNRCYRHAIDDADCCVNRRHWQALLDLLEVFDPATTHILEYWLDSSLFSNWRKPAKKPETTPEIIRRDLRAYRQLGIDSFTTFAVYMDGEYFDTYGDRELLDYCESLNQF